MNLANLETFLAIADAGSLVRASETLHITQSAVTARLKSLEAEVGQTLVFREKSGAVLTASGLRLKRYAETMRDLWRQARQEISLPEGVRTICNVGCDAGLWRGLGDELLEKIHSEEPDIALSIWTGGQLELTSWLSNGLVNMTLCYAPESRTGLSVFPLEPDKLVLVSTQANGPTRFDPGYIFVEAGEEFGRLHAATYADAGTAKISFSSPEWALNHILRYGGSAYLPFRMLTNELKDERLFLLPDAPEFERPVYLVVDDRAAAPWDWFPQILKSEPGNAEIKSRNPSPSR